MQIKFRANSPLILDYLRYIFNTKQGETIRISTTNDFGRMAVGLYKTCDFLDDTIDDELTVRLILPHTNATRAALTRYICYTATDLSRLNHILDSLFNIDLDTYYIQGIQAGMLKRDIIEAFILSRGLASIDYTDTLSKRTYRTALSTIKTKTDILLRKARYHQSLIRSNSTLK